MFRTARPSTRALAGRALLAGVATGLRSLATLGALAAWRDEAPRHAGWRSWPVIRSNAGRRVMQLAWAGEMMSDKLPVIPPRTNPGPLTGRIAFGALAGLAIGTEGRGAAPRIAGTVLGAVGAAGAAWAGTTWRTVLTQGLDLPDLPGALAEDALAITIARKVVRR